MRELAKRYRCLFDPLEELESFQSLTKALEKPGVYSAYGPDDAQRAHLIAGVMRKLVRPALVVPNEMAALRDGGSRPVARRPRAQPARAGHLISQDRRIQPRSGHAPHRGAGRLRHGQGRRARRVRRRDDEPPDAGRALSRAHHLHLGIHAHGTCGADVPPDGGRLRARTARRKPRPVRAARRHPRRLSRRRGQRAAHRVLRRRNRFHPQLRRHDPAVDLAPPVRAAVPGVRDAAQRRRSAAGGADPQQPAQVRADGQGRQPPEKDRSRIQPDPV